MTTDDKPKPKNQLMGGVASVLGMAVGVYSGINLIIPLAASGAAYWAGSRFARPVNQAYLSAIAVLAGHTLWLSFGIALTGQWNTLIADVALITIGIAWLWFRPGLWPVAIITLLQALALVVNGANFIEAPIASSGHRALLIHIIWRVLAIFFMWYAYIRIARESKTVKSDA